jgi:hypothetical protein
MSVSNWTSPTAAARHLANAPPTQSPVLTLIGSHLLNLPLEVIENIVDNSLNQGNLLNFLLVNKHISRCAVKCIESFLYGEAARKTDEIYVDKISINSGLKLDFQYANLETCAKKFYLMRPYRSLMSIKYHFDIFWKNKLVQADFKRIFTSSLGVALSMLQAIQHKQVEPTVRICQTSYALQISFITVKALFEYTKKVNDIKNLHTLIEHHLLPIFYREAESGEKPLKNIIDIYTTAISVIKIHQAPTKQTTLNNEVTESIRKVIDQRACMVEDIKALVKIAPSTSPDLIESLCKKTESPQLEPKDTCEVLWLAIDQASFVQRDQQRTWIAIIQTFCSMTHRLAPFFEREQVMQILNWIEAKTSDTNLSIPYLLPNLAEAKAGFGDYNGALEHLDKIFKKIPSFKSNCIKIACNIARLDLKQAHRFFSWAFEASKKMIVPIELYLSPDVPTIFNTIFAVLNVQTHYCQEIENLISLASHNVLLNKDKNISATLAYSIDTFKARFGVNQ